MKRLIGWDAPGYAGPSFRGGCLDFYRKPSRRRAWFYLRFVGYSRIGCGIITKIVVFLLTKRSVVFVAAKDLIHEPVRKALENDGWTITNDPLTLQYEDKYVLADLDAERFVIGAERGLEKIAVEIKSFVHRSIMQDLEQALGQYIVYLTFLEKVDRERKLYLATTDVAYDPIAESKAIQLLLHRYQVPLLIVNPERKEIVAWIES